MKDTTNSIYKYRAKKNFQSNLKGIATMAFLILCAAAIAFVAIKVGRGELGSLDIRNKAATLCDGISPETCPSPDCRWNTTKTMCEPSFLPTTDDYGQTTTPRPNATTRPNSTARPTAKPRN